jgi:hypothetical protein
MQSRRERTVFLFTMLLMLGAFLAGQLFVGDITGAATGEAWDFESASTASDYFNVTKESLGEDMINFIISFIMTFAVMYYASGMAFGASAGSFGAGSGNAAVSIFALAGSLMGSWYYSEFIVRYLAFFLAIMFATTLGGYILKLKDGDRNAWHTLFASGVGFTILGLSMFYFEYLAMKGWGAIVAIIGVILVIVGIIGTMSKWDFGKGGNNNSDLPPTKRYEQDIDNLKDIGGELKSPEIPGLERDSELIANQIINALSRDNYREAYRLAVVELNRLQTEIKILEKHRKKVMKVKLHKGNKELKEVFNLMEKNVQERENILGKRYYRFGRGGMKVRRSTLLIYLKKSMKHEKPYMIKRLDWQTAKRMAIQILSKWFVKAEQDFHALEKKREEILGEEYQEIVKDAKGAKQEDAEFKQAEFAKIQAMKDILNRLKDIEAKLRPLKDKPEFTALQKEVAKIYRGFRMEYMDARDLEENPYNAKDRKQIKALALTVIKLAKDSIRIIETSKRSAGGDELDKLMEIEQDFYKIIRDEALIAKTTRRQASGSPRLISQ